jgi:hypothetical protein
MVLESHRLNVMLLETDLFLATRGASIAERFDFLGNSFVRVNVGLFPNKKTPGELK